MLNLPPPKPPPPAAPAAASASAVGSAGTGRGSARVGVMAAGYLSSSVDSEHFRAAPRTAGTFRGNLGVR
jgi:hypothetical protein